MATPATAMNVQSEQRTEIENLPKLFTRLGDDVTRLFDTKMSLLRVEVKEDVTALLRAGIGIAVASMVALIGFALGSAAAAVGIATQLTKTGFSQPAAYGLGLLIVGLLYLILGTIAAFVIKGRLSKQSLVPNRTIDEIRKDKEWLKKEL
jgi:uncharacterized membrane protein YqjE